MDWEEMGKRPRTMYHGMYYHTIEAAGRVSIPAPFREQLGERAVAAPSADLCVNLFSVSAWAVQVEALSEARSASSIDRDYVRLILHQAVELKIDDHGRVQLPDSLRTKRQLHKHVVFAGSLDHVELWDRDSYHKHMEQLETRSVAIADAYAERHHA